ncbi:MAG: hypothetical protein K2O81_04805 [Clostridia bacterium]|nr:hypothetical protein [Clostridia bacterium]
MVHVFKYKNYNYIYDSGSGSLHECDGKTYDYLSSMLGQPVDISYLTAAEKTEIEGDIAALKEVGLLFKEETKARPAKSNCCHTFFSA